MNEDVAKFALGLLHGVTNAHILHLRADTYAIHKAMGHFYEDLGELVDSFVEGYQGKYGKIENYGAEYNPPPASATEYVIGFMEWIEKYRQTIPQDSYLQNQVDEMAQLIASTANKLRFYK